MLSGLAMPHRDLGTDTCRRYSVLSLQQMCSQERTCGVGSMCSVNGADHNLKHCLVYISARTRVQCLCHIRTLCANRRRLLPVRAITELSEFVMAYVQAFDRMTRTLYQPKLTFPGFHVHQIPVNFTDGRRAIYGQERVDCESTIY